MKREFSPVHLALVLILGCITFRLLSSLFPEFIPNVSPLMAIAYVGAMYLPRRWGWLVGPAILLVTDLAFLKLNYRTDGVMFSWGTVIALGLYAAAGGLGIVISQHKSLAKIIGGSLVCSLLFYLVTNTFAWWHAGSTGLTIGYPQTLAGWWQANTVGLPGYPAAWHFLRNAMAGDLFFVFVFLLVLDRGLLFGHAPARASARAASV